MDRSDWFGVGVVVSFVSAITMLLSLTIAADSERWTKADDQGNCYIHSVQDNRVWWSNTKSTPAHRETYCRKG